MPTANTPLLGLALPVTGDLSGSWGDEVNNAITSLLDDAVAGTTSITVDADITLTTTALATNQSRQAIILWNPAAGTTTRNITAPAQSKVYTVINASGGTQSIVFRGVGPTTGVTIVKGESAVVAWNGTDFIKVSNTSGAGVFTDLTVSGTTTLSGGTANGVAYLNGSKVLTSGSALTFDGSYLDVVGSANIGSDSNNALFVNSTSTVVTLSAAGRSAPLDSSLSLATTSVGVTASRAILDPLGNFKLGNTAPANWSPLYQALQVGPSAAMYSVTSNSFLLNNAYIAGDMFGDVPTYLSTNAASYYAQTALGQHQWFTAPSGTAGNAITFTKKMELNSTGLDVTGTATISGAVTLSAGEANGVAFLNGSKVLSSSSFFTYSDTNGISLLRALNQSGNTSFTGTTSIGSSSGTSTANPFFQFQGRNDWPLPQILRFQADYVSGADSGMGLTISSRVADGTFQNRYRLLADGTAHIWSLGATGIERLRLDSSGNLVQSAPTTPPSLATNGTMVFNLTSNTNLRVSVRGSDGVTRIANITLA
jgi:hypothetical protein